MSLHNVAFIHIPKTGGLAIEETLCLESLRAERNVEKFFTQSGHICFGHQNYSDLCRRGVISEEFDKTAFKFAFCRNPYDRAVSFWEHARLRRPEVAGSAPTFLEFVHRMEELDYKPQSWWLHDVQLSYLGRFENLEMHVREIARIIGREIKGEVVKKNVTPHSPYWQYYCDESKRLVETYSLEDFERFGYERDDNMLGGA